MSVCLAPENPIKKVKKLKLITYEKNKIFKHTIKKSDINLVSKIIRSVG